MAIWEIKFKFYICRDCSNIVEYINPNTNHKAMKKITTLKRLLKIQSIILLLLGSLLFSASAQKLPKIQKTSIRAPENIKIDGELTEWNDRFQAYSPVNRIYYTISNDNQNLYLTIRAEDGYANEKSLLGITFTIKKPTEKGDKSSKKIVVIFPDQIEPSKNDPIRLAMTAFRLMKKDTTNETKRKKDSLRLLTNTRMNELYKEIYVTGIKDIQEPSIPIYNTTGIKVAVQLDAANQYVYELAIPLVNLGPSINGGQRFSYNIKMNGIPDVASNGAPTPRVDRPQGAVVSNREMDNLYLNSSTDFSGEYTLAK